MHEIVSPLKRGIKSSRLLQKAINRRQPLKRRIVKRVYLSDAETIGLLEEHQRGRGGFGFPKKHLRSLLTLEGNFKAGYYLKVGTEGKLHLISTGREFQAAPIVRWQGKGSNFGSKALYWGPKLEDTVSNGSFLLSLEPFRRDGGLDAGGNRALVNVEEIQRNLDFVTRMRSWIQIITTPTADTPGTTVLLHFDKNRYLFGNISEGTQRACTEGRFALSKVNSVFLTGTVNWRTTGGIIGMILTLADIAITQNANRETKLKIDKGHYADQPRLDLHGGKNLTHLLATTRKFVFRKGLPIEVHEMKADQEQDEDKTRDRMPTYIDDNIKVWAMPINADTSLRMPRKRSHEEMSGDSPTESNKPTSGDDLSKDEIEHLNDQIRKGVVSHMFDSNWQLDALKPMKLREVEMPAAIFVRNSEGKIEKYEGLLPGGDELVPDIEVLVRMPWPGASIESLPPTTPSFEAMSYIVKNHPQRGKFDPVQAKILGIKPGPRFRELVEGKSVTTGNGKIVTPEMVIGPGKQGGGFAIVELPDKSYIDNLIHREEWSSKKVMDGVGAIIWILGRGVVEDPRLLEFRETHSKLSHIISSPDNSPNRLTMEGAAAAAIRLNQLDPERFPVPVYDNSLIPGSSEPNKYIKALPGLKVQLEPMIETQSDCVFPFLDTAEVIENASVEVHRLAEIARTTINDPTYLAKLDVMQQDIPSKDAEVIILGSGSALPSKSRNVSATLLRVPGYGNYLFDCGENTLGQMKRVFGGELPQVLKDLKLIWISHLHADHHLGTASVIKEWYEETEKDKATQSNRLMVASEKCMLDWLTEYSEVENYGYIRLRLVEMNGFQLSQKKFDQSDTETYGLTSITACHVNHCRGSLAVVLALPNGFKVAYSGDCLPSNEFARIGKGATLLIHEATFDDELAGDALAKKHCTTRDALRIGKLMGARRILLTHFSQRYQMVPLTESKGGADQIAIVAFDYMRVKIGDFAKVEHFKPALLELYKDKEER